jgi:hypothetical protein
VWARNWQNGELSKKSCAGSFKETVHLYRQTAINKNMMDLSAERVYNDEQSVIRNKEKIEIPTSLWPLALVNTGTFFWFLYSDIHRQWQLHQPLLK